MTIKTRQLGMRVDYVYENTDEPEWLICLVVYPDGGTGYRAYLIEDLVADGGEQEILDAIKPLPRVLQGALEYVDG